MTEARKFVLLHGVGGGSWIWKLNADDLVEQRKWQRPADFADNFKTRR
jgi:hypothetical protein